MTPLSLQTKDESAPGLAPQAHAAPPLPVRRRLRLRDQARSSRSERVTSTFAENVETAVQHSIGRIRRNRSEGTEESESLIFLQALLDQTGNGEVETEGVSGLTLLTKPVGLYEFRLYDRKFAGIDHPIPRPAAEEEETASLDDRRIRQLFNEVVFRSVESQRQEIQGCAAGNGTVRRRPSPLELLTALLGHLHEAGTQDVRGPDAGSSPRFRPVHPGRRAAIREWHERQEELKRADFHHSLDASASFTYPIVEAVPLLNRYLALFLMSPLNLNFIDEKVAEDERVNPVTLAVFDVGNRFSRTLLDAVMPLLRQGFGRVLFTHMTDLNGFALEISVGELGKISRFWVTHASDGLRGLLADEDLKRPFDAFTFCEAVVNTVLCRIPQVASEVYPFDRVLLFREVGVKDLSAGEDEGGVEQRQKVPIEVQVLEASIVSNNPADRGRFLTRRERRLRDTQDYECDPSQKIVRDRDRLRFYVHGHGDHLILSRRAQVNDREKEEACQPEYRSRRSQNQPEKELYLIGHVNPENGLESRNPIESALYNLFGRVTASALEVKNVEPPSIPGEAAHEPYKTVTFKENFRKARQKTLDHFDENGLFFQYEHGLELSSQIPLLAQLLAAYNEYLDDAFRDEEEDFRRETYLEDSLSHNQIEELIALHRHQKNVEKRQRRADGEIVTHEDDLHYRQAKVVYISFSSSLHKENTSYKQQTPERNLILGDEHAFTMVLVSDFDQKKSQARLEAERKDLKIYFQMLLRQIWMDKLNEYQYLARKGRTIGICLTQLLHRVKGMLPAAADAQLKEVEDLFAGLKKLTHYESSALMNLDVRNSAELFGGLIGKKLCNEAEAAQALAEQARDWGAEGVQVKLLPSPMPRLRLIWSRAVASDAFTVTFKNACEAARRAPDDQGKEVRISARAEPDSYQHDKGRWHVVVLVESTGGPIPPERLAALNAPDPTPVDRDPGKARSTGIGVFVSRYQLQNVIGQGADLLFVNTADKFVQVRMRLPAELLEDEIVELTQPRIEKPPTEYVLYVEDDPAQYEPIGRQLEELLAPRHLAVRHCRDRMSAYEVAKIRLPRFVLTDLNILGNTGDAGMATTKNGLWLVKHIMELAHEENQRVPILILTAETEGLVREELGTQPDRFRYRVVARDEKLTYGCLHILPEKKADLKKPPRLLRLLDSILLDETNGSPPAPQTPCRLLTYTELENGFEQRCFDEVVILQARARTWPKLAEHLRRWFQHPGVPDPDPEFRDPGERHRLTNHVYLRRLLLALEVDKEAARTSVRFRYWGLSKNLFVTTSGVEPATLADTWRRLRHETRGPLSTLRHDLTNQWDRPALVEPFEEVLARIRGCEQLLLLAEDRERTLESFFHEDKKDVAGGDLRKLAAAADPERERTEVKEALNGVIETLLAGRLREPSLAATIDGQTEALRRLRDYLGGVR